MGEYSDKLINIITERDNKNIGYNAVTSKIEDLFETGIIDPLKVARIALVNANSVASTLLTTEVTIHEEI